MKLHGYIPLNVIMWQRKRALTVKKALGIYDLTLFLFCRTFNIEKGALIHARVPMSSKLFLRRTLKATISNALVVRYVR